MKDPKTIAKLHLQITSCTRCPRLVEWRESIAKEKVARFRDWEYWGKPIPGFGDTKARLLIVGLAPAAHGGPSGCSAVRRNSSRYASALTSNSSGTSAVIAGNFK